MSPVDPFFALPVDEFHRAAALFRPFEDHLCPKSVIAGNTPGQIYLQKDASGNAVLWNRMDGIYLVMNKSAVFFDAFYGLITREIAPDAAGRFIPVLNLTCHPDAVKDPISARFAQFRPTQTPRYTFSYQGADVSPAPLPDDWTLHPIDEGLLVQTELKNHSAMLGWIRSFWPATKNFVERGIGYCALKGDTIGSWCLSVFAAGDAYELGVATAPDLQGLGLATAVSAACVRQCLDLSATPHWQCDQNNLPSVRIAEKLGFVIDGRYKNLTLHIEELIPKEIRN